MITKMFLLSFLVLWFSQSWPVWILKNTMREYRGKSLNIIEASLWHWDVLSISKHSSSLSNSQKFWGQGRLVKPIRIMDFGAGGVVIQCDAFHGAGELCRRWRWAFGRWQVILEKGNAAPERIESREVYRKILENHGQPCFFLILFL